MRHPLKPYSHRWMACAWLFILHCSLFISPVGAQVGTWRAYMAYQEPQQIVNGGHQLFVRASDNLYSYNLNDQSITTYDKVSNLSDNGINLIAWNNAANRLIIVYSNSNIDLMDAQGNITNISAIYSKSMTQDKTIHGIYVNDVYAYLNTGFGVVKINMQRGEVSESYILNRNAISMGIADGYIYIKTRDTFNRVDYDIDNSTLSPGTVVSDVVVEYAGSGNNKRPLKKTVVIEGNHRALMTHNLIDPHSWEYTESVPAGIYNADNTDWDTYHELVATLKPDGPAYNYFNFMQFNNGRLYTTGGGWRDGTQFFRPGCAQILDRDDNWECITNLQPMEGARFIDATSMAIDPNDNSIIYVSTCGTGLYKLQNGELVKNYTPSNSPLNSSSGDSPDYVRVEGLCFDNDGLLWMSCSSHNSKGNMVLSLNTKTEEWNTYDDELLYNNGNRLRILRSTTIDLDGNIWMANDHHDMACLIKINPTTGRIQRFADFVNQDGVTYTVFSVHGMVFDRDQNLWVGTDKGLFMFDHEQQQNPELGMTQIKVPRNDGSNYADYLMTGVDISAITIDGADRKWLGTDGGGVYLISADNMEQLHHFTTSNSKLISNHIESIAIDDATGIVYFGTNQGLCSYQADATAASIDMTKDNVYAYPNPVLSTYNGLISVVGLSFDADVKILSASGKLVAEGRSNGGTFTWDGRDRQGHRVASGIYMVATAKSDGSKGVVAKIAFVN